MKALCLKITEKSLIQHCERSDLGLHLTATSYNREPNFPILKKIRIPDYDAILKGPTQLEKPPKDFWLGCPWAGLRPKTRVTQILVLKLKNALPKPYDELVKKFLYQNYNPQMVV